jgi:hypothetical protein
MASRDIERSSASHVTCSPMQAIANSVNLALFNP